MKETAEQMKARIRATIARDYQTRIFGAILEQGKNGYLRCQRVYPRA